MTAIALLRQPFYFLRHGETALNAAGLVCGQSDVPLTPRGEAQARAAVEVLTTLGIASVWCSPMRRARATAKPFADRSGLPVRIVDGLAERNWGDWEGRPRTEIRRDATPPGGESPDTFRTRVVAALGLIDGPWPVLIVGHAGIGRTIARLVTGEAERETIRNATPYRCEPASDGRTGAMTEVDAG
ncbi:histidine phosphatase family protein [Marinivivus vitaminiproducens]|uniref:histidine phosphatase family protein n=1 Tax=Marinivivus vitaminiproducens TaxID=3035935 RepID=UPI0027A6B0C7|nr:histidine phosphatase family protein [Geminicoccaceae bacterium SCSIO 64248]